MLFNFLPFITSPEHNILFELQFFDAGNALSLLADPMLTRAT